MLPRIKRFQPVSEFKLLLTFTDGRQGEVDLLPHFQGKPGLLGELAQLERFKQVRVDEEADTLSWPNGVDLDPDVLYSEATGAPLPGGSASAP